MASGDRDSARVVTSGYRFESRQKHRQAGVTPRLVGYGIVGSSDKQVSRMHRLHGRPASQPRSRVLQRLASTRGQSGQARDFAIMRTYSMPRPPSSGCAPRRSGRCATKHPRPGCVPGRRRELPKVFQCSGASRRRAEEAAAPGGATCLQPRHGMTSMLSVSTLLLSGLKV